MGQLVFLLLLLFAIICAMYGISAGVQTIQNGLARLFGLGRRPSPVRANAPPSRELPQQCAAAPAQPELSAAQRCLDELKELCRLHQTGALSQEEFEQLKRYLLSTITYPKQEAP